MECSAEDEHVREEITFGYPRRERVESVVREAPDGQAGSIFGVAGKPEIRDDLRDRLSVVEHPECQCKGGSRRS